MLKLNTKTLVIGKTQSQKCLSRKWLQALNKNLEEIEEDENTLDNAPKNEHTEEIVPKIEYKLTKFNMSNYFSDLVGQDAVKRKLTFYLNAFHKTSQAPFLLMTGAKGLGKTEFAKNFAKNLHNQDGEKRAAFLELNCSTIKNNEQFFEQIFLPLICDNEITILFDECHELPQDLTMAFLSIFNTESNSRKNFEWNGMNFEFNFMKQTFIFATTETDKIFPPLKDRLTIVDFEPYSKKELAEIVKLLRTDPDIFITDECIQEVATTIRGNARSAVKMQKEINLYCGDKMIAILLMLMISKNYLTLLGFFLLD